MTEQQQEVHQASVLVVDDDPGNLSAVSRLLRPYYAVQAAPTGERALQIAASAPQPDLILLDVLMPGMDGYDVMVCLHDNPATRDIPVIFTSGLDSSEDEERGLKLGAVDYIAKPYHTAILLARVRTQLELSQMRDRLAHRNTYLEAEMARRLPEKLQVQLQLMQSEKMAAIGQPTVGITHKINDPVAFVSSKLCSLELYLQDIFELLDAYEAQEESCAPDKVSLLKIRELKQQKDISLMRDNIVHLLSESRQGLTRIARIVSDSCN